jgi:hypothetical protein
MTPRTIVGCILFAISMFLITETCRH